ncbi:MAG: DUF2723 domain-containing protein [Aquificaceae bacterium]|nr:DUF2723 domain-containing protein [Aquificaceae bacterium]
MFKEFMKFLKAHHPVSHAIIIFVFFIALYSFTLYPGPGGRINYGDSAKWQFVFLTDYIPHSTGYPFYILLSKLFYYIIPVGPTYLKITLISAVFGALTNAILFMLLYRISGSMLNSLFITFVFGTTQTFWILSTEAEVYTLNSFFIVLILYLCYLFYQTSHEVYIYAISILFAFSLGNHMTSAVFTLSPLILILYKKPTIFLKKKFVATILLSLLILVGEYAYTYKSYINTVRDMSINYFYEVNQASFFDYISGAQFKQQMWDWQKFTSSLMNFSLTDFPSEIISYKQAYEAVYIHYIIFIFFSVLYAVSIISIFFSQHTILLLSFFAPFLIYTLYSFSYLIADYITYYIPIYIFIFLSLSSISPYERFNRLKTLLISILFVVNLISIPQKFMNLYQTKNYLLTFKLEHIKHLEGKVVIHTDLDDYHSMMLEYYLTVTKEYGNYTFVYPMRERYNSYSEVYAIRGFIESLHELSEYSEKMDKRNLASTLTHGMSAKLNLHKSIHANIKETKLDFMRVPLDLIAEHYRDKFILVVGGAESYYSLNSSHSFRQYLMDSGSEAIKTLCHGEAYVGLYYKGKLLKESSSLKNAVFKLNEGEVIKNIRIPKGLEVITRGSDKCMNLEDGLSKLYMASSLLRIDKDTHMLRNYLNVIVLDTEFNIVDKLEYYKSQFASNDVFLLKLR